MNILNRAFLCNKQHNYATLPEKVLQFGEGNFLRAFFDVFVDELNEKGHFGGSIVIVQPIPEGMASAINAQEGCYTVVLRGLESAAGTQGNNLLEDTLPVISKASSSVARKRIISSISRAIDPYANFDIYMAALENPHLRFIVSNTTEAGISYAGTDKLNDRPPASFPGKVTALLYERYKLFNGDPSKGFIFMPCELIDNNGDTLKEIVLRHAANWQLPQGFINWVHEANYFTNTLVDRIVSGYPKDDIGRLESELGYRDNLLVTGELFHFFAIEGSREILQEISEVMPFHKTEHNVVLVDDISSYKLRKVRILNGTHTMSALAAILSGKSTVYEMMGDSLFAEYIRKGLFQEIIPALDFHFYSQDLEYESGSFTPSSQEIFKIEESLPSFAAAVLDRFANPYIKHNLSSIALNSVSKFKVRILPTIIDYHKNTGQLPQLLTFSFAALLAFYLCQRESEIVDVDEVLTFFRAWRKPVCVADMPCKVGDISDMVKDTCAQDTFWGMDLNQLPGFYTNVMDYLYDILENGVVQAIGKLI